MIIRGESQMTQCEGKRERLIKRGKGWENQHLCGVWASPHHSPQTPQTNKLIYVAPTIVSKIIIVNVLI